MHWPVGELAMDRAAGGARRERQIEPWDGPVPERFCPALNAQHSEPEHFVRVAR
jgi:hypothetical protein